MALFGIFMSCQQKNQTESPELLKQVLFDFSDGLKNKEKENDVKVYDIAELIAKAKGLS